MRCYQSSCGQEIRTPLAHPWLYFILFYFIFSAATFYVVIRNLIKSKPLVGWLSVTRSTIYRYVFFLYTLFMIYKLRLLTEAAVWPTTQFSEVSQRQQQQLQRDRLIGFLTIEEMVTHFLHFIPLFFFFLLFASKVFALVGGDCPVSMCSKLDPIIRFPFRLPDVQPQRCGYPGFELSCDDSSRTTLDLPSSGAFLVDNINYVSQEIQLHDSSGCLPKRLMELDLSGSPFTGFRYQNYTFLSCSSEFTASRFRPIPCLSNSTRSVLAIASVSLASMLSTLCEIMRNVSIPVSRPPPFESGFSSELGDVLRLTWETPSCGDCEARGGICSFTTNSTVGCFDRDVDAGSNWPI
uniref:RING-type E3 ubiquitin transferase n=1 Tax=Nelumbo nucifera TaxID=4432 RepID=A0A822YXP1_NELNU|nr:TPA_asm: hypothetical protein HUJ06_006921 [Nelumbo nucifera]